MAKFFNFYKAEHIHREIHPLSIFFSIISPTVLLVIFVYGYLIFYQKFENLFFYHIFAGFILIVSISLGWLISRMFILVDQISTASRHLAAVGESIDDALIGRNLDGIITSWNQGAEKVYGYKAEEVVGKPFSLIIPPEKEKEFDELVGQLKRGKKIRHYETVRVKKDGTKIIVSLNVAPVIDEDGSIMGAATIAHDITERVMLERSRDTFFAIASHELRTPLTAIRGNTALIKDKFYDSVCKDADVKGMIDDIYESSVRLINIVTDFLDVSSLELGKISFNKGKVNMTELIQDNWREYRSLAQAKKLSFELKMGDGLPSVVGDSSRIRQVLANLVLNAITYTYHGGLTVELRRKDNFAEVLVEDTGTGILPENHKLLFQKFQQAGPSVYTRDATKGTGVGLYLSKLLVEGMGGKIGLVQSEVNKGSTFSFTLPLAKE